jgi:hypothetical protein
MELNIKEENNDPFKDSNISPILSKDNNQVNQL